MASFDTVPMTSTTTTPTKFTMSLTPTTATTTFSHRKKKVLPIFERALAEAAAAATIVNDDDNIVATNAPTTTTLEGASSSSSSSSSSLFSSSSSSYTKTMDKNNNTLISSWNQCHDYYEKAETNALNGKYPESLRQFDLCLRFWGIHLQALNGLLSHSSRNVATQSSHLFQNSNNTEGSEYKYDKDALIVNNNNNNNNKDENEEAIITTDYTIDLNKKNKKWKNPLAEKINEHKNLGAKIFEAQAQVLLEMDRDFDAIVCCKEAIACDPYWSVAYLTLSRAELNFGDACSALETAKKACSLDPTNLEIVEHLADVQQIITTIDSQRIADDLPENRKYMRMVRIDSNQAKGNNNYLKNDSERLKKRLKMRKSNAIMNEIGGKLQRLSLETRTKVTNNTQNRTTSSTQTKRFGVLNDYKTNSDDDNSIINID